MEEEAKTNMETGNGPEPEKTGHRERVRRWIFALLFKHGVLYSLALSVIIFTAYMIGSMPDPGISDRILFILLRLLWYSSLLLCFFSLFAMGAKVRHLVYYPSFRSAVSLFLYFAAAILGAALAIINSFIIATTGGNV